MKHLGFLAQSAALLVVLCPAGLVLVGCSTTSGAEADDQAPATDPAGEQTAAGGHEAAPGQAKPGTGGPHGSGHGSGGAGPMAESGKSFSGIVRETMNSGGYTYMHVEVEGEGDMRWAAAEKASVAVGDHVVLKVSMQARGFHSPTLDRTFDALWFVYIEESSGAGGSGSDPGPHGGPAGSASDETTDTI